MRAVVAGRNRRAASSGREGEVLFSSLVIRKRCVFLDSCLRMHSAEVIQGLLPGGTLTDVRFLLSCCIPSWVNGDAGSILGPVVHWYSMGLSMVDGDEGEVGAGSFLFGKQTPQQPCPPLYKFARVGRRWRSLQMISLA